MRSRVRRNHGAPWPTRRCGCAVAPGAPGVRVHSGQYRDTARGRAARRCGRPAREPDNISNVAPKVMLSYPNAQRWRCSTRLNAVVSDVTEDATSLAREAAAGFGRLRLPFFEAQALEEAGDVDAALTLFHQCGAAYDVLRLEGERRQLNADLPFRCASARSRNWPPRGRSNIEIARALSITHKTVEKHLGSVYQKLHISSRAQLDSYVAPGRERAVPNG